MNISKEILRTKIVNSYTFSYFEKGFYYFQKPILPKGFNLIRVEEEDFSNGNFEFMCENELTK